MKRRFSINGYQLKAKNSAETRKQKDFTLNNASYLHTTNAASGRELFDSAILHENMLLHTSEIKGMCVRIRENERIVRSVVKLASRLNGIA